MDSPIDASNAPIPARQAPVLTRAEAKAQKKGIKLEKLKLGLVDKMKFPDVTKVTTMRTSRGHIAGAKGYKRKELKQQRRTIRKQMKGIEKDVKAMRKARKKIAKLKTPAAQAEIAKLSKGIAARKNEHKLLKGQRKNFQMKIRKTKMARFLKTVGRALAVVTGFAVAAIAVAGLVSNPVGWVLLGAGALLALSVSAKMISESGYSKKSAVMQTAGFGAVGAGLCVGAGALGAGAAVAGPAAQAGAALSAVGETSAGMAINGAITSAGAHIAAGATAGAGVLGSAIATEASSAAGSIGPGRKY